MSLLCKLSFHKWLTVTTYTPHIYAEIVTAYTIKTSCVKCGKVKQYEHQEWDGENFNEKYNQ